MPVVVYDACVLYPSPLRDFLIRVAIEELVCARWSERILDEVFRSIARDRPDLDQIRLTRTRQRMCQAVIDCIVEGYEEIEGCRLYPRFRQIPCSGRWPPNGSQANHRWPEC